MGDAEETVQNIAANQARFVSGLFCYLTTLICDFFVAWAFYVLLRPVSGTVALLTAWFRVGYAIIALVALSKLGTVLRIVRAPDYLSSYQPDQLHAQVMLALRAFGDGWNMGFSLFGIHLGFLGCLVFRSGYIPKILDIRRKFNDVQQLPVSSTDRRLRAPSDPRRRVRPLAATLSTRPLCTPWRVRGGADAETRPACACSLLRHHPPCGAEMRVLAFVLDTHTVDSILRHEKNRTRSANLYTDGCADSRAPPV